MGKGEMGRTCECVMDEDEGDLGREDQQIDRNVDMIRDNDGEEIIEEKKGGALVRSAGHEEHVGNCRDGAERNGDSDSRHGCARQRTVGDRGRGGTVDSEGLMESLRGQAASMKAKTGELLDKGEVTPLVRVGKARVISKAPIVSKVT